MLFDVGTANHRVVCSMGNGFLSFGPFFIFFFFYYIFDVEGLGDTIEMHHLTHSYYIYTCVCKHVSCLFGDGSMCSSSMMAIRRLHYILGGR